MCRPVLQILTLFQTKKISFFTPFIRPGLENLYPFSDLTFKKLCHHYLDENSNKKDFLESMSKSSSGTQKSCSPRSLLFFAQFFSAHLDFPSPPLSAPGSPRMCRNRILLFLSYSFGIETISTFVHSRSSLKNHTRFQTSLRKHPFLLALRRWGRFARGETDVFAG